MGKLKTENGKTEKTGKLEIAQKIENGNNGNLKKSQNRKVPWDL